MNTYNDMVHSTKVMESSRVTDVDVLAICGWMEAKRRDGHVSRRATRAHQQKEDELCQGSGAQVKHRSI